MRGYALIAQGVVYPAPWLQFGEPAGATAGELLQIPVNVRHGTVVAATIELADGRVLDLDVYGDRFELLLPPDAADGPAIVRVRLVDLTGNTSSAQTVVLLAGVPVAPPVSAPGGLPRQVPHRLVRSSPVELRVTAAPGALRRRGPARTIVVLGLPGARRVRSSPQMRGRSTPARVRVTAGSARLLAGRHDAVASIPLRPGATAVTRRDGAALEEALLLDLL
jgi:hypothetical protein